MSEELKMSSIVIDEINPELPANPGTAVNLIEFDGHSSLGFGDGHISLAARLASGDLSPDTLKTGLDIIINPASYEKIEINEPACIDGRRSRLTYYYAGGQRQEATSSKLRPKVVGGGLITILAGQIGAGNIPDTSLQQIEQAAVFLRANNMPYGAHTGHTDKNEDSGCGAIDKLPEIIANVQHYEPSVEASLKTIFGDSFDPAVFSEVIDNYQSTFQKINYKKYAGQNTIKTIEDDGVVIKELDGKHLECAVILNNVEGTTFNQSALGGATRGQVQVFSLDVWVLKNYAKLLGASNEHIEKKSLYGMLVYGLSALATLTDGSQKIYSHTNI